jgi:hypothetical protein
LLHPHLSDTNIPQLIEVWETFLMQLDAEEDAPFGLSQPPAGLVPTSSAADSSTAASEGAGTTSDDQTLVNQDDDDEA